MSDYNEGDLIEAVKGESVIRGRLHPSGSSGEMWVGDSGRFLSLLGSGWKVTVIEKAKPPLPTEPGLYLDRLHNIRHAWIIYPAGSGSEPGLFCARHHDGCGSFKEGPEAFAPFTRLEPVPETAKRVLAQVGSGAIVRTPDMMSIRYLVLENIASEFGVTE